MRPLLSILIYSNSWVALCVACLMGGIIHHFQLYHPYVYVPWSFFGTVSAYQLHRLFRLRHLKHTVRSNRRLLWMQNSYSLQLFWFILNALAFAGYTYFVPLTPHIFYILVINAAIVGLYAFPLPIIRNGIRHLPFAKNILISLSWIGMLILPFVEILRDIPLELPVLLFTAVFAQIIPFDIRDLPYDPTSLKTIPQIIGIIPSRIIGFGLLTVCVCLQWQLIGFHWISILVLIAGFVGHFLPYKVGYQLRLEFMWELPLGLMGLWFWII